MVENIYHLGLKKMARDSLEAQGYFVKEEHPIRIKGKSYRVDIVGFELKNGLLSKPKVAIECGKTSAKKLEALRAVFDVVKVFDLPEAMDYLVRCISSQELSKREKVEYLQEKLKAYQKAYSRIKDEYNKLKRKWDMISDVREVKGEKKKLLQIRCTEKVLKFFRKFCVDGYFKSQEEALLDLLHLNKIREDILYHKVVPRDISVEMERVKS